MAVYVLISPLAARWDATGCMEEVCVLEDKGILATLRCLCPEGYQVEAAWFAGEETAGSDTSTFADLGIEAQCMPPHT